MRNNAAYDDAAGLFEQAAVLITGSALAHAFSDGNKRLALLAGTISLDLNGFAVRAPAHAFAEQILAIGSMLNRWICLIPQFLAELVHLPEAMLFFLISSPCACSFDARLPWHRGR